MKSVLIAAAFGTGALFAQAGEYAANGCRAEWTERTLTVSNAAFSASFSISGGMLRTTSFKAAGGIEWQKTAAKASGPFAVKATSAKWSPVGVEGLRLDIESEGKATRVDVYPNVPGVVFTRSEILPVPPAPSRGKYRDFLGWSGGLVQNATKCGDVITFAPRHVRASAITCLDQTDTSNRVWDERTWILSGNDCCETVSATALDCRDVLTGDGMVFVRIAPMPASRPGMKEDFLLKGDRMAVLANGYPVAALAYRGGESGRIRATTAFQRALRPYLPGRDGILLSNNWGGGNGDSRICASFLEKEIEAGGKIGVDVIQVDDGWQRGRTANSRKQPNPGIPKVWNDYWKTDPLFWTEDRERFPEGLDPLVKKAAAKGMRFGLWFGPDSVDDMANWQRDADCLLDYHRRLGIDYFKIDSVKALTSQALARNRMMYDRMLGLSGGAMVFDLDCTAETRPGFFGLMDIGPLFVENRYLHGGYWPHMTLKNLWELSHLIDPVRLRMEFDNPDANHGKPAYVGSPLAHAHYRPDALFATVMAASPLAWMELSDISEKSVEALSAIVRVWKRERDRWYGTIHPVGGVPDGVAWTGFVSEAADRAGGYALLFRELNRSPDYALDMDGFFAGEVSSAEVIAGRGTAQVSGKTLNVSIPENLDYLWIKLR